MTEPNLIEKLDAAIAGFLGSWNIFTSLLAGVLVIFLLWPILTGKDPDLHPYLLARQAQAAPVRQQGQSAVYRANEIPYGYPLRKGLNVKDPGAPKWNAGRDGDLRDIWRTAVKGPVDDSGSPTGPRGKLFTIRGKDKASEHTLDEVTRAINAIGKYIQENGGKNVAVSLSNSPELLAAIFASSFYAFKPILVPLGLPQSQLSVLLSQANADFLIAEAGSVELSAVSSTAPSVRHIIWVTKEANRHLDWNEVPAGIGGKIELSTWHELVEERKATATSEVPALEKDTTHGPIAAVIDDGTGGYKITEYTVTNLVAAVGALQATIARSAKITHADTLISTLPLTDSYALCWTLLALFSGASIALNSVAGEAVDINNAVAGVKPTIVVTSAASITKVAPRLAMLENSLTSKINNYLNRKSLATGVFPTKSPFALKTHPNLQVVRLLLIAQSTSSPTSRISSSLLATLRLALGVRLAYALTSPDVVGAVTQTNVLDYRDKGLSVNVGVPVTACEVYVAGAEENVELDKARGKLNVVGPSVIGQKSVDLGVEAEIDTDHTINLL